MNDLAPHAAPEALATGAAVAEDAVAEDAVAEDAVAEDALDEDVIAAVAAVVEGLRSAERPEELELELRFGALEKRGFVSRVPRAFMDTALRRLATNAACVSTDWTEHHDFFYAPTPAVARVHPEARALRTRVEFDVYELALRPTTVVKRKLREVTLRCSDGVALRVTLSRETPVDSAVLPTTAETTHVRVKQRKRVVWGRDAAQPAAWAYDFSIGWSGVSRSAAEQRRRDASGTHEFEIELLRGPYLVTRSTRYVATSLLMKARDFLPAGATLSVYSATQACA